MPSPGSSYRWPSPPPASFSRPAPASAQAPARPAGHLRPEAARLGRFLRSQCRPRRAARHDDLRTRRRPADRVGQQHRQRRGPVLRPLLRPGSRHLHRCGPRHPVPCRRQRSESGRDLVVLTNDDRLFGKIQGMTPDDVAFDSTSAGFLKISKRCIKQMWFQGSVDALARTNFTTGQPGRCRLTRGGWQIAGGALAHQRRPSPPRCRSTRAAPSPWS